MTTLYGCNGRPPFKTEVPVQEGWRDILGGSVDSRMALMVHIPFRMERDCQFTKTALGRVDSRCAGCQWRLP